MKRIALISHGLSNGGAERVASILANQLVMRGYTVLFLAVYSEEKEYTLDKNVEYRYVGSKKNNKLLKLLERAQNIKKTVVDFGADVTISFIANETILLSLETKIPLVYSLRNDPAALMRKRVDRILCPFLYGRSKNVVFQTLDARAFFDEKIQKKGVIIGNPLTPNLPYWDTSNMKKRVITAGRLVLQKNHRMLISAFSKFVKEFPDYTLEIYGSGSMEEELRQYIRELQLEKKVFLMGHSNNIHEIMAHSAIFALSSDFEGLSNAMLEAMAIGIPSVCTDCPPGGAAEYIIDGENGMLVPIRDVDAMYQKMCMLAGDLELSSQISKGSREIRSILREDVVIDQWQKVIENALK